MVEVLPFVELFELVVEILRLYHVALPCQEIDVLISENIFVLGQHLYPRQPVFEPLSPAFYKPGEVVGNFPVGVKAEDVSGGVEADFELVEEGGAGWDAHFLYSKFDQGVDEEDGKEVVASDDAFPKLLSLCAFEEGRDVVDLEGYFTASLFLQKVLQLGRVVLQKVSFICPHELLQGPVS